MNIKLRSFTLIEMIIVIVIISIMLLITLNISSNQTKELRFRIARENFLANYNSFIIRALTTNSNNMQLIFAGTGKSMTISGNSTNSIYFEDTSTINISKFNDTTPFVNQILSFDTNLGQCSIFGTTTITGGTVNFILQYTPYPSIEKCYELNLSTCKLRACP